MQKGCYRVCQLALPEDACTENMSENKRCRERDGQMHFGEVSSPDGCGGACSPMAYEPEGQGLKPGGNTGEFSEAGA